ncbi:alanine--glyoxylate aminotransferase family protein [Psychrobacter okhotskensis]|uniref:aminotransferase class V-fold PLP-dependent enzyme n=1 Tax=Psychrobacter okhotskensis TaxID=212403 RepID=UPI0015664E34|nr:aminotransferase class V-fold PLP-dependent enzyme [Psychrobacter okhotskensis]NRD70102.1 alanine--glyoxylate aminotransferase family protein [Psychrobacter okhotskensis]
MTALRQDIDPNGLLEYSVVYTDRALNHMSKVFQQVMNDLSSELKSVYNADAVAIVPGSGTYGMEAVARQLAKDEDCLIIRNGWFSYRWTQILEKGNIAKSSTVLTADRTEDTEAPEPFTPVDIDVAVVKIKEQKPAIVFAPHVETSAGIILPDDYIKALGEAVHSVGGLLVIDCIASGCVWLDMKALGIDVLISAPQKGWSSTPCAGLVMLSDAAVKKVESTESDSFSLDLKQWLNIMRAYENGGHAYHATMPTDGLRQFRDTINEAKEVGFDKLSEAQWELGNRIRKVLEDKGVESVAAKGFEAPGVVVAYTERDDMHKGSAFAEAGLQIAAGVPLKVGEPENFKTFRLGLFGLDKLTGVDGAVQRFESALDKVLAK